MERGGVDSGAALTLLPSLALDNGTSLRRRVDARVLSAKQHLSDPKWGLHD
jgi:hypothetical protein